jgi:serine phosphatase RsbU (regulator of sigma subunit)
MDTQARHWNHHEVSMLRALADVAQFLTEARLGAEGQLAQRAERARVHDQQQTARLAVYEALADDHNQVQALNRRLQHALLPRPTAPAGLDVEIFYQPGSDRLLLGGDFLDTRPVGEDQLDFVLGDVTGHGPEAAALAISLRASWRALRAVGTPPAQVAAVLDEQTADAALYATLLFGSLRRDGTLTLVNAGHPSAVAVGGDGGPTEIEGLPGPMLGLGLESTVWTPSEHQLGARTFLAYTDGLIEGRIHDSSERFGTERLLATIAEVGPEPELLCRAATEANHEPLPDDVAILRIDRA